MKEILRISRPATHIEMCATSTCRKPMDYARLDALVVGLALAHAGAT